MECEYVKAIKSKYTKGVIKAFYIATKGIIYCPICKTDHEFKEDEEDAKV